MRIAVLVVMTLTSSARADDDFYPRVSAGAGVGVRFGELARLQSTGAALALQAEVRVRPTLFVMATYDHAAGTARDEMRVQEVDVTSRVAGLALRTLLVSFGDKPRELGGDMYFTGGIAREWVGWDGGGLARDALVLGAGTTLVLPHERTHQQLRFGLRMAFARAPDLGKRPAGCDGPCDTSTKTAPYDMAIVMEVSCHLGR